MSLWDTKTGTCVSGGGDDAMHGLSTKSLHFLNGMLEHAPALLALTNPTVNSYKRLNARGTASGATWSPTAATWAGNNRSALVRVPGGARRMELRVADMSANPYLMAAAIGAAGLDGLANGAMPPPPCDRNMYDLSDPIVAAAVAAAPPLPKELPAALDQLDASAVLRARLGGGFVDSYLKVTCARARASYTPFHTLTHTQIEELFVHWYTHELHRDTHEPRARGVHGVYPRRRVLRSTFPRACNKCSMST